MVAQLADGKLRIPTEVRGAPSWLFTGRPSGEIIVAGPAGTGKTRAILEYIHDRAAKETIRVLILRKTLESLKTSALVTYQEQVLYGFDGKRSAADRVTYFGGNRIRPADFTYEDTGSKVILGGMDNPSKVLSTEYDVVYVNECVELALEDWEQITKRTDRPRLGPQPSPSLVIGDCNPGAPTHWIKQRAAEGKLQLWSSYHRDNPAMWDTDRRIWTEAGIRYFARLGGLTGIRRQRFLLGLWVAAEGQVYDAWREDVHILRREDAADRLIGATYVGSADWGWRSPGVAQVWAIDRDARLYLVAEHYHTQRPFEAWWVPRFAQLDARYEPDVWACDPSEPQNIERLRAEGLDAVPAVNDLLPGIGAVQDRIAPAGDGLPRLYVLADALVERDEWLVEHRLPWSTAQEMPEYVWAKNADGRVLKDKPIDAHNHGLDALRYAVAHQDLGGRVAPLTPEWLAAFDWRSA
jgi:hypothetical protein